MQSERHTFLVFRGNPIAPCSTPSGGFSPSVAFTFRLSSTVQALVVELRFGTLLERMGSLFGERSRHSPPGLSGSNRSLSVCVSVCSAISQEQ